VGKEDTPLTSLPVEVISRRLSTKSNHLCSSSNQQKVHKHLMYSLGLFVLICVSAKLPIGAAQGRPRKMKMKTIYIRDGNRTTTWRVPQTWDCLMNIWKWV